MKHTVLNLVATGRLSGAEKVVSDICTNLDKNNFKVIVACAGEELKGYYTEKGLETKIIDISKLNIFEIIKLRKLIVSENINLVHAHDVKASVASQIAVKGLGIPVISHIHGNYLWLANNFLMKGIDAYFREKYTLTIACSSKAQEFYKGYNNSFDYNKLIVLGNCFNFDEFRKIQLMDREEFKNKQSIPNGKYIFGYIGRLIKLKGVDLIIRSFKEFSKKNDDALLVIVGDGEEKENLKNLCREINVENKVLFMGYQKDVYNYLNVFDAFVIASQREGLPLVVLEAMAMGKIIISTPVGGIPEVIKNKCTGILLKERNEKFLIESMNYVFDNKEEANVIAEQGTKFLKEHRNIKNYIEMLEKIYLGNMK